MVVGDLQERRSKKGRVVRVVFVGLRESVKERECVVEGEVEKVFFFLTLSKNFLWEIAAWFCLCAISGFWEKEKGQKDVYFIFGIV